MPDPAFIIAVIGVVLTGICAIVAVASLIIQHHRTPKLPKPPHTPVCTTILGASMRSGINNLPTYHQGMDRIGFKRNLRR